MSWHGVKGYARTVPDQRSSPPLITSLSQHITQLHYTPPDSADRKQY